MSETATANPAPVPDPNRWRGTPLSGDELEAVQASCAAAGALHLLQMVKGIALPHPTGFHLLVLQFVRPAKVGSIIMAETSKKEDVWQGRCGVVLRFGPDAYRDETKFPAGAWCEVGDWVIWPPIESAAARLAYGDAVLALIPDDRVLVTGADPFLANLSG
jgi:hypothetical protein